MVSLNQLVNRNMPVELPSGTITVPELTTNQYLEMVKIDNLSGEELHKRRIEFVNKILNLNKEKVEVNLYELPYSYVNAVWSNLVEFTFIILSDPN